MFLYNTYVWHLVYQHVSNLCCCLLLARTARHKAKQENQCCVLARKRGLGLDPPAELAVEPLNDIRSSNGLPLRLGKRKSMEVLMLFAPACRPDLRCTHRLGHAEKDHDTLSAASSRQRLGRRGVAAVDVLPVVHGPHVPGGADCNIGQHLQPPTDVTAGRRDLLTRLEAGRTVLGARAAQLNDWTC